MADYLSVVWGSELATGVLANAATPGTAGWLTRPYPPPPVHARWGEVWQYPPPSPLWFDGTKWTLPEEPSLPPNISYSHPIFQMRPTGIHHRGRYVGS